MPYCILEMQQFNILTQHVQVPSNCRVMNTDTEPTLTNQMQNDQHQTTAYTASYRKKLMLSPTQSLNECIHVYRKTGKNSTRKPNYYFLNFKRYHNNK